MRFTRAYNTVVLIVVLAHAAVLWEAATPSLRMPRGKPDGTPMAVRLLTPSRESGSGSDVLASLPVPSGSPLAAAQQEALQAFLSRPTTGRVQLPQGPQDIQSTIASPAAQPKGRPDSNDGAADFLEYLPRSRLSAPAQPITSIEVSFPEGDPGLVDLKVQATLFIDESGTVRRARVDSPNAPREFIQAVLDSFLAARFKPAEVQTVAVRSQLRIEVEFRATR